MVKPDITEEIKVQDNIHFDIEQSEAGTGAADFRPVFPKEVLLIGIILNVMNPLALQKSSVWKGKGFYVIDGKKIRINAAKLKRLPA